MVGAKVFEREVPLSLLGMPREMDPNAKNLAECFQRIPSVPLTISNDMCPGGWNSSFHSSTGFNVSRPLRYASRATRQSVKDICARGFRCNPAPKRSISYWIDGESRTRPRKARLTFGGSHSQYANRWIRVGFLPTTTGGCLERKRGGRSIPIVQREVFRLVTEVSNLSDPTWGLWGGVVRRECCCRLGT